MTASTEIFYPCEDDQPLAETQAHALAIITLVTVLQVYLGDRAVIFADQFFYTVAGNPNIRVAPDVMVVFDIPKKLYDSYKLWETKQVPAVIFEVTSGSTRAVDLTKKKDLYEGVGVREYWLFDPFGEWIEGQLLGYELNERGKYQEASMPYCSRVLGVRLVPEDHLLRLYRLDNGEKLLTIAEERQNALAEKQRADRLAAKLRQLGIDPDKI